MLKLFTDLVKVACYKYNHGGLMYAATLLPLFSFNGCLFYTPVVESFTIYLKVLQKLFGFKPDAFVGRFLSV